MSRETDYVLMGIQCIIKALFHTSKKRVVWSMIWE